MRQRCCLGTLITILGLGLAFAPARAQTPGDTISGTVTDSAQRPIDRVRVTVVGTTLATDTRVDGRYVLTGVADGPARVRFNRLGYLPVELPVTVVAGRSTTLNAVLQPVAVKLNEMVVVAYGTELRKDVTGSVATVNADEIQQTAVNTLEQGLAGRVPGVNIIQADAAPGGSMIVQIRGVNSPSGISTPLYVIDGVPIETSGVDKLTLLNQTDGNASNLTETNPLAELNPDDIESVNILKDASATALYGSRAANGVVIITTKRGHKGQPGRFNLNVQQSYGVVGKTLDVLNAEQYANYVNDAYAHAYPGQPAQLPYGGRPGSQTPAQIAQIYGNGTNWQDSIYRTAPITNINLSWSGGDEHGSYNIGGNWLDQAGVIRGSNFNRAGLRVNIDRDVTPWFKLSSSNELTRSTNDMVFTATQTTQNEAGIVRSAVTYPPFFPVADTAIYRIDPTFTDPTFLSQYGANPLNYINSVPETEQYTRAVTHLGSTTDLTHGFAADVSVGAQYEGRSYSLYTPSTVQEGGTTNGMAVVASSDFYSILSENLLRYNHSFDGGVHRLDVVGGYTYEFDHSNYISNTVEDFPNDLLGANDLQEGLVDLPPQTGHNIWELESWLGRVNYVYKDRYLFTAAFRTDGSSKFAANNKWADFPSFAFAWRPLEEDFLKGKTPLSDLKLRVSWGLTGNTSIQPYQSLSQITPIPTTIDENAVSALQQTAVGNPNLKWETTSQWDVGLDAGAFNQRVTFTGDAYYKRTTDLLQQITLPDNTGYANLYVNSGIVTNKGIELGLNVDVLRPRHPDGLAINVGANAWHNSNNVVSLGPGIEQQFGPTLGAGQLSIFTPFIQRAGLPIGTIWGYKTYGIYKTQAEVNADLTYDPQACLGCVRYVNPKDPQDVTPAIQQSIGNVNPQWTYGFTTRWTWHHFDLSSLVTMVKGNSIINVELSRYLVLNGTINVPKQYVDGAYDPVTNPNGKYPEINANNAQFGRFSDLFVENGSYLRLKNVQIGYTFNLPGARTARVYVGGINLLTATNYQGYDPEVSAVGDGQSLDVNHMPGVDQGSYPMQRIFQFGLNTSF
jgi:TonB-linked SusC/RagA family outer membrane protein